MKNWAKGNRVGLVAPGLLAFASIGMAADAAGYTFSLATIERDDKSESNLLRSGTVAVKRQLLGTVVQKNCQFHICE